MLEEYKSQLTTHRNTLHKIPESGFEERKTSDYIQSVLKKLDVNYKVVEKTGVIVYFKGSKGNKTIAFRSDIDGLSVEEKSNNPIHSEHAGYMHACGHDGHMSMLLTFATYLSENQSQLNDNVVLIFQPAEEGPGGAKPIVDSGILKDYGVDEIYGIHLYPVVEQGKIGVCKGPMMAMTGEFDIDIISKSSHGAMPHEGIDAIVIASELMMGLQNIVSRNVSPIKPSVITVGKFEAGERRNVIAGSARLEGTMRAFDKSIYQLMKARMNTYLEGLEKAYGVTITLEVRDMYPPVINDANLVDKLIAAQGDGVCEIIEPQMISEDFSYYQEVIPGVFYFVGTYNEALGHIHPLHSSYFNFDHEALYNGFRSYVNLLQAGGSIDL